MTSIRELYEAIAIGPLKAVGLHAFDHVPGSSEWPGAFLLPPVVEYESLADTVLELRTDIVVLVSATVDINQLKLLDYMDDQGPRSIPLAFHQNPSFGLNGVSGFIARSRPLNFEQQAGYQAFGAVFESSIRLSA